MARCHVNEAESVGVSKELGGRLEIPAAGALVFDARRRILLVLRGREPARGLWSIPGGKCLPGESAADCCVRETYEETGLRVEVVAYAGRVERNAPAGGVFVIDDFECSLPRDSLPESARAGDDAEAVGWFSRAELVEMLTVDGLVDALTLWSLMPT